MQVRNERLENLLQQEPVRRSAQQDGQGFEQMFAQQLVQESGCGTPQSTTLPGGINPLAFMEQADASEEATGDADLLASTLTDTDALLGAWEEYAKRLDSGQDIRSAWNLLAGMGGQVKSLRENLGQLGARGQGLESVINELDVLTTTETIKFNRGDYQ